MHVFYLLLAPRTLAYFLCSMFPTVPYTDPGKIMSLLHEYVKIILAQKTEMYI